MNDKKMVPKNAIKVRTAITATLYYHKLIFMVSDQTKVDNEYIVTIQHLKEHFNEK